MPWTLTFCCDSQSNEPCSPTPSGSFVVLVLVMVVVAKVQEVQHQAAWRGTFLCPRQLAAVVGPVIYMECNRSMYS